MRLFQFFSRLFGGKKALRNEDGAVELKSVDKKIFRIKLEQLICAQSSGNKSQVYFKENSTNVSIHTRHSLKNLEESLCKPNGRIIRCHKSYIVNLDRIEKVAGTTKGFKLHIKDLDFVVPVSRRLGIDDINQPDLFSA
tara:strand:- start:443 stop:859 length:417 start_codon:yes stop_codon:yes gene_type:complete